MRQIADKLKEQVYISGDNVEAIRKYIRIKRPGCTEEQLSGVFADALHRIIDSKLYQFEEKHRKKIKAAVLKKAVEKSEFSIDASEVFNSCLAVKLHEDGYIESLTQWINQNQTIPVSVSQVDKLLANAEQFDAAYIENNLYALVDEFEENRAEDQALSVMETGIDEPAAPVVSYVRLISGALDRLRAVKPDRRLVLQVMLLLAIVVVLSFTGLPGYKRIQGLRPPEQGRYADITGDQLDRYISLEARMLDKLHGMTGKRVLVLLDGLHEEFRYQEVDQGKLKKWLEHRDSILSEEPYFTAILETSRKYDIHPALMLAIVGQEQDFVPRDGAAARKIANNPFNVYGSWEKYNTDIYDSSSLAASTIIESSRNRPAYMNTIRWINRRYAEDPNWWNGVSSLFAQIKKEI